MGKSYVPVKNGDFPYTLNHRRAYLLLKKKHNSTGWWFQPLWKRWKSIGMMKFPYIMENHKIHVPNHQPEHHYWSILFGLIILGMTNWLSQKNIWKSMGRIIPYIMENKTFLKPPTSQGFPGGLHLLITGHFFRRIQLRLQVLTLCFYLAPPGNQRSNQPRRPSHGDSPELNR